MAVKPTKAKKKPGRPASVDLYPGKVFGMLVVRGRVHTKEGLRIRVECICGKIFLTRTQYLTRKPNPQVHCGCKKNEGANPYPREKGIWTMMYIRTEDPRHVSYHRYGARGIKVCADWHKTNPKGWENFIAFMGPAPSKRHSIDRVNPNLGYQPYAPDGSVQCRWATAKEQANNQERHWFNGKKIKP